MNTQVLTVSSKGQISLPVAIRKLLSIDAGDKLVAYASGDVIMLKTLKLPTAEEFEASLDVILHIGARPHKDITVQTSGGNTFYIVIDYDKPVDEDGEQYETYFFSIVDEADLLAAMEAAGMEVPACACTDKCMAGAINTDCPVCATNMTECVGVEPEPVEDTEPVDDPEPEQPEDTDGNMGTILLILAIAAVGGGAGWYFKVYRPKQQRATEAVEEDYGDELDAFDDLEDDTPPWDEDEV